MKLLTSCEVRLVLLGTFNDVVCGNCELSLGIQNQTKFEEPVHESYPCWKLSMVCIYSGTSAARTGLGSQDAR